MANHPNRSMQDPSFKATKDDYLLIDAIVARAVADGVIQKRHSMNVNMDLNACHSNGCPMDFKALFGSDPGNFAHDVCGITRHIDRRTGQLQDCFLPRFNAIPREADLRKAVVAV